MKRDDYLAHHGIKGQKWGVRRFQNQDGSYTPAGEKRYSDQKKTVNNYRGMVQPFVARSGKNNAYKDAGNIYGIGRKADYHLGQDGSLYPLASGTGRATLLGYPLHSGTYAEVLKNAYDAISQLEGSEFNYKDHYTGKVNFGKIWNADIDSIKPYGEGNSFIGALEMEWIGETLDEIPEEVYDAILEAQRIAEEKRKALEEEAEKKEKEREERLKTYKEQRAATAKYNAHNLKGPKAKEKVHKVL